MKGISSRKGKNGTVYWYAWLDGKKTYCGKDEQGHKDALEAKQKYEYEKLQAQREGRGQEVRKTTFRRFEEMLDWYMKLAADQLRDNTYTRYVQATPHLIKHFGRKPISGIEIVDLEQYRIHRRKEGRSHRTINAEIGLMRTIYRKAKSNKMVPQDAGPGEYELKKKYAPRRLITDEEYLKLLDATKEDPDFQDLMICAYESSMRPAEIRNLQVRDIHLGEVVSEVPERVVADYLDVEM